MVDINPNVFEISSNVNDLYTSIKRHQFLEKIKTQLYIFYNKVISNIKAQTSYK